MAVAVKTDAAAGRETIDRSLRQPLMVRPEVDNLMRTGLLIAALTALFMAVGYWISGWPRSHPRLIVPSEVEHG